VPDLNVETVKLIAAGVGECVGGKHPDPPLDDYPLLVWTGDHAKFGKMVVILEDQKASVEQVALEYCAAPNLDAIATKFGTTGEHVMQAVDYAAKAVSLVSK
jgi:hypothetical protein